MTLVFRVSNQVPLVVSVRQLPVKEAGLLARQLQAPAVMSGINAPSFSVYSGRIVERREPRPGDGADPKRAFAGAGLARNALPATRDRAGADLTDRC
ncbi:MAG: hypothetical protein IPK09_00030 [Candidatus Competibacteraceae bacterium]|nr:hypothetical protein [Candidatus Competibacteraceae bacterium]